MEDFKACCDEFRILMDKGLIVLSWWAEQKRFFWRAELLNQHTGQKHQGIELLFCPFCGTELF